MTQRHYDEHVRAKNQPSSFRHPHLGRFAFTREDGELSFLATLPSASVEPNLPLLTPAILC